MKLYSSARDLPSVPGRERATASEVPDNFPGMNSTDRAPREEILHRAYAIWEREGHPDDRKLANWLEAEAEMKASQ